MSHEWIAKSLENEKLTADGKKITALIEQFQIGDNCPYQRWISLVTGRQLYKHKKANGAHHEVQIVLHLPETILYY
jgi:hypothetical protein